MQEWTDCQFKRKSEIFELVVLTLYAVDAQNWSMSFIFCWQFLSAAQLIGEHPVVELWCFHTVILLQIPKINVRFQTYIHTDVFTRWSDSKCYHHSTVLVTASGFLRGKDTINIFASIFFWLISDKINSSTHDELDQTLNRTHSSLFLSVCLHHHWNKHRRRCNFSKSDVWQMEVFCWRKLAVHSCFQTPTLSVPLVSNFKSQHLLSLC